MQYDKFETEQNFYYHYDERIGDFETNMHMRHYHNLFEIYFITSGNCTYFIDNKAYEIECGDVVLIPAGVIHNTKYRKTGHSRMLINCSQRHIPASVRPILPSLIYVYRNPVIFKDIFEIFKKIEYEYSHPDALTGEVLCCYTHTLFFLLAKNIDTCVHTDSGNDYIKSAIDYIQKNFSSEILLTDMAKMGSVSPEHFSRMFKKETGFGFSNYLNLLRLQKAERMLMQQDSLSITKIASECGFQDSNYFSLKFKNFYGISPKKLQMNNKNKA